MMMQLNSDYTNPPAGTAWSGRTQLKKAYPSVNEAAIEEKLSGVDAYTRHREPKNPVYNPFFVHRLRDLIQADLIEQQGLAPSNNGYRYWLCVIDTFSRYLWVTPLKNKDSLNVDRAFEDIIIKMTRKGGVARRLLTDTGAEFTSGSFARLLRKYDIKHSFPNNLHAPHIERVQRTILGIMGKQLTHTEGRRYIHMLPKIVSTYNHRIHRMIEMAPYRAERPVNHVAVRKAMTKHHAKAIRLTKKPKYSVGQYVRVVVSKEVNKFKKSYDETYDKEIYIVEEVLTHLPRPMYRLRRGDDVVLDDKYYEEEMQLVSNDLFKIDKVLENRIRRGRRESLVKWQGWSGSPEWIPASNVRDI